MENQLLTVEIQKLSKELEGQRNTLASVIGLLVGLSNAVNEGFDKVNERLSVLEGKQGMQGVNSQLLEIKHELHKIQKAYQYDELFNNIQSVQGNA
jgi:hypothetical protein